MKKLSLVLAAVLGLLLGCTELKEGFNAVPFKPIPKVQAGGNYTTDIETDAKATRECQRHNLHQLVGRTFMAYPDNQLVPPFTDPVVDENYIHGRFGVRSPEKFTIVSVQDTQYQGFSKDFVLNIKFESGKIAYMDIQESGFFSGSFEGYGRSFPELCNCLKMIYDASMKKSK